MKYANISLRNKASILVLLTIAAVVAVFMQGPIAEKSSYHDFADKRIFWGIPNFFNVVSNLPFLITGTAGLLAIRKAAVSRELASTSDSLASAPGALTFIYAVMFAGVLLTGAGSAFYHYSPDNNTLVYDRIPMTIVFMSLLSATLSEFVTLRSGIFLLAPLLFTGVYSVLWWHHTELQGGGDLRLYILVQYYPILLIPLILFLFPSAKYQRGTLQLVLVTVWYIIAKVFDQCDQAIYSFTGFISGHTLKHLAAAGATWYLVRSFQYKHTVVAAA